MWLYTTVGFFSVVMKPVKPGAPGDLLVVRARAEGDLEALRDKYMPDLGPIISTPNGDYKYRAAITPQAFTAGLAALVADVTYSNFKSEVMTAQGYEREGVYMRVWGASRALDNFRLRPGPARRQAPLWGGSE